MVPALVENEMNPQRSMTAGWLGVHANRVHEAASLSILGMLKEA
jgi:hypothetical protein